MAATGTIAVHPGSDLRFGGAVTFDVTTAGLKGNEYPMVYVEAFQDVDGDGQADDLVYGQLDHADATFILGGGSSLWVSRGGGAAHCRATLYVYGGKVHGNDVIVFLASVDFEASA